jgi:hypothetical protein
MGRSPVRFTSLYPDGAGAPCLHVRPARGVLMTASRSSVAYWPARTDELPVQAGSEALASEPALMLSGIPGSPEDEEKGGAAIAA